MSIESSDLPSGSSEQNPEGESGRVHTEPEQASSADEKQAKSQLDFFVVGLGASAGGLEAFKTFLTAAPNDTGMAFVLVQHLDPDHESMMVDLLSRYTNMPVLQVTDAMDVRPNQVYMIPPGKYLTLEGKQLKLAEPVAKRGMRMPIDHFFESLAEAQVDKAMAIVLSGTGSDGSLGMRMVKGNGGLTAVQDPEQAAHDGMPRSAIATGMVDLVLPIEEMPKTLLQYSQHPFVNGNRAAAAQEIAGRTTIETILAVLHSRIGHDFSSYKRNTLVRRIQRRMGLNHITEPRDYAALLRESQKEVDALFRDLLIGVTGFFREPEAWHVLEESIVPGLVRNCPAGEAIRIWSPGCASGEEAYSLAILFHEAVDRMQTRCTVQVFATDIDKNAYEKARAGIYPESIAAEVSAERLRRYFTKIEDGYQIGKDIRDSVMFASQNLLRDPPFAKLDMVSCRNLLIYLQNDIQRKVIQLFHFALNDQGYLFLGTSESIGTQTDLFKVVDKKWRIYQKMGTSRTGLVELPLFSTPSFKSLVADRPHVRRGRPFDPTHVAQHVLLDRYVPASVLINPKGEVIYFHGPVRRYLDYPSGEPTVDIYAIAMDGLRTKLRALVRRVRLDRGKTATEEAKVRRDDGQSYRVSISVTSLGQQQETEGLLLISFEDIPETAAATPSPESRADRIEGDQDEIVRHLEDELHSTRQELESAIEELETSNEELKASNEEAMSMNEELQSTNEELETSKEELQSLNEELTTVNNELREKVDQLEQANNDTANLLTSTHVATIFLDRHFKIKRFTPAVTELFNLIPSDINRPLGDIVQKFNDDRLLPDCRNVLQELKVHETEIVTQEGSWFIRRALPYRTQDDHIEGVVITFVNVTHLKKAQAETAAAREHLKLAIEGARLGTWQYLPLTGENIGDELNAKILTGRVPDHPFSYEDWVQVLHPDDRSRVVKVLEKSLAPESGGEYTIEYRVVWHDGSVHWVHARGQAYFDTIDGRRQPVRVLGVVQDITQQKENEHRLEHFKEELERLVRKRTELAEQRADQLRRLAGALTQAEQRERRRLASTLHDHLQQLLAASRLRISLFKKSNTDGEHMDLIEEADQFLKLSIEQARSLSLELSPPILYEAGLEAGLRWLAGWIESRHKLHVTIHTTTEIPRLEHDREAFLFTTAKELLFNVSKHAGTDEAAVTLEARPDKSFALTVEDQGNGFDLAQLDEVDEELEHFGLLSIRERVSGLGGQFDVASEPGKGTRVTIVVPCSDAASNSQAAASRARPPVETPDPDSVIRVLVADDHPIAREGLVRILQLSEDIAIVGEAHNGEQAIQACRELRPDVVLMDINMPLMNGFEATKALKTEMPEVKVIGLSVAGSGTRIEKTMREAGASEYLAKDAGSEEIIGAIRRVAGQEASGSAD